MITYALWLADQALGGLRYAWPITIGLVVLGVAAITVDILRRKTSSSRRLASLLLPFVGTVVILASGSIFRERESFYFFPYLGLALCVGLAIFAVFRCRPMWMTAASVSLCTVWWSLWCAFVSVMSITGDWI